MEMATFAKLFSGTVYGLIGSLFVAAQPFEPPGRAAAVPELAGVYGPLRTASAGEADGTRDRLTFTPDGAGGYRVLALADGRTFAFRAQVYEEWGLRYLDLVPEADLGWDRKTKGSHLLIGLSLSDGELALRGLRPDDRVYRFYRRKAG